MKKPLIIAVFLCLLLGLVGIAPGCSWELQPHVYGSPMKRFQSAAEFIRAFQNGWQGYYYPEESFSLSANGAATLKAESSMEREHSTTNVQVEGIDEADIVKNDGEYIYLISRDTVFVLQAYPPEDMRILSRIPFDGEAVPSEMFIRGDRLVVIGSSYVDSYKDHRESSDYYSSQFVFIKIYDISDRSDPKLVKTVEYEGTYNTSRMIDDNIYVIITSYPHYIIMEDEIIQPDDIIPLCRSFAGGEEPGDLEPVCDWSEVECLDPEYCSSFLSILSMSVEDGSESYEKKVIAGNANAVYASYENIYVTAAPFYAYMDELSSSESEHTTVYKFRLVGTSVMFMASADVPGTVLNQFSMDESKGYFRIATTIGHVSRMGSGSTNNVYILDAALNITGRLEGLAEGETIYSARFVGDRAYLVTFKKVDPFFVLDLSNPSHPEVLGALKIPGYSDYLHPYDENHIIGVGKNTVEADPAEGDFAWYQGIKIALFDVTNVSDPKEMYKIEIGDRGTDSYALRDHKAFLFDRGKDLLVLPILLAELTPEQKESGGASGSVHGQITYQGAYVYDISLRGGFKLGGRITHADSSQDIHYDSDSNVERSLYIENTLYTISRAKVKANSLVDLAEQASVDLE